MDREKDGNKNTETDGSKRGRCTDKNNDEHDGHNNRNKHNK